MHCCRWSRAVCLPPAASLTGCVIIVQCVATPCRQAVRPERAAMLSRGEHSHDGGELSLFSAQTVLYRASWRCEPRDCVGSTTGILRLRCAVQSWGCIYFARCPSKLTGVSPVHVELDKFHTSVCPRGAGRSRKRRPGVMNSCHCHCNLTALPAKP